jgi:hypothetical protein
LVDASIEKYRYFCGETWARFGEEKWMSGWQELYHRSPGDTTGILCELRSIKVNLSDPARRYFWMKTRTMMRSISCFPEAFDSDGVKELRIFSIGDGEAMSGFLIAADIVDLGRLFVAFLMD